MRGARPDAARRAPRRHDDERHAGRPGRHPEEIAHAAVYLASDEARFVHGIVLDVDGGRTTAAVIAG